MKDIPALIAAIQDLQTRYIAGDRDAGADLYGYRMQLVKALHLDRRWRCAVCHQDGKPTRYDGQICRSCDQALAARSERRCVKCGNVQALSSFHLPSRGCKACTAARLTAHHASNRAAYQAQKHRYYGETRDEHLARHKRWRDENPEKYRASQRAWREKNREHYNETQRLWDAKKRKAS